MRKASFLLVDVLKIHGIYVLAKAKLWGQKKISACQGFGGGGWTAKGYEGSLRGVEIFFLIVVVVTAYMFVRIHRTEH